MRVTIHRTRCKILHRPPNPSTVWSEYRFAPSTGSCVELPTSSELIRSDSQPIEIDAPVGSRVVQVKLKSDKPHRVPPELVRLVTHYDADGIDATAVYGLARKGARGFRFASPTEPTVAPEPRETTLPPGGIEPVPVPTATRWGIAFTTGPLGHRSWLAQFSTEGGPIAGIRDMARVARWNDHADAEEWFRANGMQVDQLVSPGLDWVYPSIELIPEGETPCGCEFEINSRPSVLAQARLIQAELPPSNPRPNKHPRRQRAGQAVFAFAEVDL